MSWKRSPGRLACGVPTIDLVLAGVCGEHGGVDRQQHGEERGAFLDGQFAEPAGGFRVESVVGPAAVVGAQRGAGPVGGDLAARDAGEPVFPVLQVGLPAGVVARLGDVEATYSEQSASGRGAGPSVR